MLTSKNPWVLLHLMQVKNQPKNLNSLNKWQTYSDFLPWRGHCVCGLGIHRCWYIPHPSQVRHGHDFGHQVWWCWWFGQQVPTEQSQILLLTCIVRYVTLQYVIYALYRYKQFIFFQLFNLNNIRFLFPIVIFLLFKSELEMERTDIVAVWREIESSLNMYPSIRMFE